MRMGKRGVKTDLRRESPDVRNKFLIRPPTTYLQPVCIAKESMRHVSLSGEKGGMTTNLLTKIKCFLLTGEVVLHPILGTLNKPSLRIVKKKYSSLPFAFTGILPLPGHSRFVKIYLIRQSLTAFCFSLRPPSSGYSCIRHYLLVPYGF